MKMAQTGERKNISDKMEINSSSYQSELSFRKMRKNQNCWREGITRRKGCNIGSKNCVAKLVTHKVGYSQLLEK